MSENSYIDLIPSYLEGDLSETEKAAFEAALGEDRLLREEVEAALKAKLVIHHTAKELQKEQLIQEFPIKTQHPPSTNMWKWAAAAAIVILIGSAIVLLPKQKVQPEDMFAQYYELAPAQQSRSENPLQDSLLQAAHIAYAKGNFSEASIQYREFLATAENEASKSEVQLFLGHSLVQTGKLTEAEDAFIQARKYQPEMAEWNLILVYLKMNQPEAVDPLLQLILEEPDHYYHDQAREVVDQLN